MCSSRRLLPETVTQSTSDSCMAILRNADFMQKTPCIPRAHDERHGIKCCIGICRWHAPGCRRKYCARQPKTCTLTTQVIVVRLSCLGFRHVSHNSKVQARDGSKMPQRKRKHGTLGRRGA